MRIRKYLWGVVCLFVAGGAVADGDGSAACDAPVYDTFRPVRQTEPSALVAIEVNMAPVAKLRVPDGFRRWGVLPHGSLGLGAHPEGVRALLHYDTPETVAVHQEGISPADFNRSVFRGSSEMGCRYLKALHLEGSDYRLYRRFDNGAELFAYGMASEHHFTLIRRDKADLVLEGVFYGVTRQSFELILSTIEMEET